MLLILNPTAGRRRRGLVDAVVRRVRAAGWTVDVVETAAAGDARRLAETCDAARYAVIAVAGGDGTINEVVNGLAAARRRAPALGIVPLGTANVLAHELGLGFSAAVIARTIIAGHELLMQPGEAANGAGVPPRCFSLMAGAGFDAKVVAGRQRAAQAPLGPRGLCLALAGRGAALSAGALRRRDRRRAARGGVGDRDARPPLCRPLCRGARRGAGRAAAACLPVRALGPLADAALRRWPCCWDGCRALAAIA